MRWEPQRVLFLPCLLIPGRALSGQCLHPLSPGGDLKTTPRNVTGYLPCPGGVLLGFCSLFIGQLAVLLIHQRSSSRALPLQTPCDLTASLRPSLTSRWRTFWPGVPQGPSACHILGACRFWSSQGQMQPLSSATKTSMPPAGGHSQVWLCAHPINPLREREGNMEEKVPSAVNGSFYLSISPLRKRHLKLICSLISIVI